MNDWFEYFHLLGYEYLYLGVPMEEMTQPERGSEGLESLRESIRNCSGCKLHPDRSHLVFGAGSPSARLVFVGEAPGLEEDRQGIPFVGRAGQLLTKMIRAMGLTREEVYICNILKCRPPGNRDPEPDEIEACQPYLIRQLDFINPEVIVALGRVSSQVLTGSPEPISRMRGHWYEYHGIPLMPTFHPSYLLRQPGKKGEAWQDLQEVMRKLNLPNPHESS